jgi:hypothetical protein
VSYATKLIFKRFHAGKAEKLAKTNRFTFHCFGHSLLKFPQKRRIFEMYDNGVPSVVPGYYAGPYGPQSVGPIPVVYGYAAAGPPLVFLDDNVPPGANMIYPPPQARPDAFISPPPASMSEDMPPVRAPKRKEDESCCDKCFVLPGLEDATCCERCTVFNTEFIITDCGHFCPCCCHTCYRRKVVKPPLGGWMCRC